MFTELVSHVDLPRIEGMSPPPGPLTACSRGALKSHGRQVPGIEILCQVSRTSEPTLFPQDCKFLMFPGIELDHFWEIRSLL